MNTVGPLFKPAYTDKGNRYQETKVATAASGAAIATGATVVALKGLKEIPFKQKITNFANKVPAPKTALQRMLAKVEELAAKAQINISKPKAQKIAKKFHMPKFRDMKASVSEMAQKIHMPKLKDVKVAITEFVKNTKNKASGLFTDAVSVVKSPKLKTGAKYLGIAAGVLALGIITDKVINMRNAHKADKN